MRLTEHHEQLVRAVRAGDLERVRAILFSLAGTGISCQRLALLDMRARNGLCVEDVAAAIDDGSDERRAILELVRSERLRMEYFE